MRSHHDGETHVIELAGELDVAGAAAVDRELRRAESSDAQVIAVDLRELTFMDSTGARSLVQAQQRSSRTGNRLMVVKGTEPIQRLFDICDVAGALSFVDRLPSDGAAASPHAPRSATSRRVSQAALAAAVRELRTHPRSATLR